MLTDTKHAHSHFMHLSRQACILHQQLTPTHIHTHVYTHANVRAQTYPQSHAHKVTHLHHTHDFVQGLRRTSIPLLKPLHLTSH
jgi:hypothetical protein